MLNYIPLKLELPGGANFATLSNVKSAAITPRQPSVPNLIGLRVKGITFEKLAQNFDLFL